jgi:antitoxin component YwqK of YwqJK toxin-antitoxin module
MLESLEKFIWNVCCISLGFIFSMNLHAQNFEDPMTGVINRVYVQYPDSLVEAFYYRGDKKIKTKDELFYYWHSAQNIKHTRGAFEGKLLHGNFTAFYYNKDLLTKGAFKYGLKQGEWKSWYQGGERKSKEKWRKGKLIGTANYYGKNGKVQRERKLSRSGNGYVLYYDENGILTSKEYYKNNALDKKNNYQLNKKGKLVEVKPEKTKTKKIKSKENSERESKFKRKKVPKENLQKEDKKDKGKRSPKIKIQKYRHVSPGGIGT